MAKTIKLKLNAPLRHYQAGTIIPIRADKKGVPLEKYWRDRIKDSAIDGCVEIVKETNTPKAATKKAETEKKGA